MPEYKSLGDALRATLHTDDHGLLTRDTVERLGEALIHFGWTPPGGTPEPPAMECEIHINPTCSECGQVMVRDSAKPFYECRTSYCSNHQRWAAPKVKLFMLDRGDSGVVGPRLGDINVDIPVICRACGNVAGVGTAHVVKIHNRPVGSSERKKDYEHMKGCPE